MRRLLLVTALTAGIALGTLVTVSDWTAEPAAAASVGSAESHTAEGTSAVGDTGVNDFEFDSFDARYTLGRDPAGRSTLTTVETPVARFPEPDQNHGIRHELVDSFDGHPIVLKVISVTDERGKPRPFKASSEDGFRTLTIAGRAYVHGEQTYVITYTSHNVTRHYADTKGDEFYWDTNGTGWRQPFAKVTAEVHLPAVLTAKLTGKADAASGFEGDNGRPRLRRPTTDSLCRR